MKYLKVLKAVADLWPVIKLFVEQVEASFPESGIGKFKLAQVLSILEGVWTDVGVAFEDARPTIERTIAAIVTLANLTKRFKSTPAPAAA